MAGCAPVPQDHGLGDSANLQKDIQYYQRATSIWTALGFHFSLPEETPRNLAVRKQISLYLNNRKRLRQAAESAKPYLFYVYQQVKLRKLPAEFALLPMLESNYDPFAYSKVGAAGLWQMMPGTASGFGVKIDWWYDGRRDIVASTTAALNYLQYLGEIFNHDWLLALAAYDVGEGAVQKAIDYNKRLGKPTDFWDLPLPQETKCYVPRLLALAAIIKYPSEYQMDWPAVPNTPYLTRVDVGSQIDLTKAAKLSGMSLEEISLYNPGFQRWATDPDGPFELLMPIDKAAKFQKALSQMPKVEPVKWVRYKVKPGDSLTAIARKFHSNANLLMQINHLPSRQIHVSKTLLIPLQKDKLPSSLTPDERQYFLKLHQNTPETQFIKYTVKPGDTVNDVAEKFHVKSREVMFWNGLKSESDLTVGKVLTIWPPRKHVFKQTFQHKVHFGETLASVAKLYQVDAADLKRANHLKTNTLRAGQILTIPATHYQTKAQHEKMITKIDAAETRKKPHGVIRYHIKSGDTLTSIAKKTGVSVNDLKRWNKFTRSNQLKTDEDLIVYH